MKNIKSKAKSADTTLTFQNTQQEIEAHKDKQLFFVGVEKLTNKFVDAVKTFAKKQGIKLNVTLIYKIEGE